MIGDGEPSALSLLLSERVATFSMFVAYLYV